MTVPFLPETMACIDIREAGGPDVLALVEKPLPKVGPGEVLIRVSAAGVNRPDVLQRLGGYAPPPGASPIPGLEVAGMVVGVGAGVTWPSLGTQVTALVAGGGYAAYCAAPAPQCLPVPRGLSLVEAAGLPETFFTVWTNVFERGALRPGESLLVHGGTSGIGTTAIQIAKCWGATVFATAGGPAKAKACVELGADRGIDYRAEDFVAVVKQATAGAGVNVILDMVGGDYTPRNIDCLAPEGRLVQIAFLRGAKVQLNMEPIMRRRLTFTGSTLRPRSVAEKGAIAAALKAQVWPMIESGRVRPVIYKTFPLAEAAEAHRLMESSAHIGKIVLTVDHV